MEPGTFTLLIAGLLGALSGIAGAVAAIIQRLRREHRAVAGAELEVRTREGDTLYRSDDAPGHDVAHVTVESPTMRAGDVVAIVQALAPAQSAQEPRGRKEWLAMWVPVIASAVGGLALIGVAVFQASAEDPVDCVSYVALLNDLRGSIDPDQAKGLFGADGLHFGDLEDECGEARPFLTAP